MLTASPRRPSRHVGRTLAVLTISLLMLAALVGAGYAVARSDRHTSAKAPPRATPAAPTTATQPTTQAAPTPSPTARPGVVPFVALAVGTPPSLGVGEAVYPWHRLTAVLRGPAQVRPGSMVDFSVTLTNPTGTAIALDPCPSYDVTVGVQTTSYGLNCAGAPAPAIAPGASVTFDIPVNIPGNVNQGARSAVTWSLGWQPDRGSPHSRVTVTVR